MNRVAASRVSIRCYAKNAYSLLAPDRLSSDPAIGIMLPRPWKQPQLGEVLPKPGCKIKVIGAGLARTGTNSFCAAVAHLLDGPAYHVGVQTVTSGIPSHVRTWAYAVKNRPYASDHIREKAMSMLKDELDGYVMTTDPPVPQLVPELMELFPDALVIVTVRDKKSWTVSMAMIIKLVRINLLNFMFFWIRGLREVPSFWDSLSSIQLERYGRPLEATEESMEASWDLHMAWMRKIVPEQKLFFYDVRDGWGPLCKILDVPVPKDVPFPRLNDTAALEAAFKSWSIQGLSLWLYAIGAVVAIASAGLYVLR